MSDYEHDIFLSYRRLGSCSTWVREHLIPVLQETMALHLGRDPDIFFDDKLELGDTWPPELGLRLGRSRILLCLWSTTFLSSKWCIAELNLMWQRERSLGMRTANNPNGLVAVVTINDGETIPEELRQCQSSEIREFYNPMMRTDSPKREDFFTHMKKHATTLVNMINNVPPYERRWENESAEQLHKLYFSPQAQEETKPLRFTQ